MRPGNVSTVARIPPSTPSAAKNCHRPEPGHHRVTAPGPSQRERRQPADTAGQALRRSGHGQVKAGTLIFCKSAAAPHPAARNCRVRRSRAPLATSTATPCPTGRSTPLCGPTRATAAIRYARACLSASPTTKRSCGHYAIEDEAEHHAQDEFKRLNRGTATLSYTLPLGRADLPPLTNGDGQRPQVGD